jgi:transcriptional regulator with XRE-family HTH domain
MKRQGIAHYNVTQMPVAAENITAADIKAEFARRLQAAMIEKGWNQSELARRVNQCLIKPPKGQKRGWKMGRDSISHYVRGAMMPLPTYLHALAKALGVRPEDLLPVSVPTAAGATPFELRGQPDGRVFLRLSRSVTSETAMKIMSLLAEEDKKP